MGERQDEYEAFKVCIDTYSEAGISGWLFMGMLPKRMPFLNVHELAFEVYRIVAGLQTDTPPEQLVSDDRGYEGFEWNHTVPWSNKFLFRKRGEIGSVLILFPKGESGKNASVTVIDKGKCLYHRDVSTCDELEACISAIAEAFVSGNSSSKCPF